MKTTSYEISKKLAEIGFQADFDYCYRKGEPERGVWSKSFEVTCWDGEDISNYYPAFDFETILSMLPKEIKFKGDTYYFWMIYSETSNCYIVGYICGHFRRAELENYKQENESLADTAAHLLIKLHGEGLIKFEGKDETN